MQLFTKFAGLDGALVLVTGGATGIGSAIVENFVRQGSRVVFLDMNAEAGEELIARLRPGTKLNPEFVHADLRDLHSLKGTIESIQRRAGPIKILVNNAANDERHEMEEITPEYWRDRLATNLDHYFFCIQGVAPAMAAAGGGSIVNLGSSVALGFSRSSSLRYRQGCDRRSHERTGAEFGSEKYPYQLRCAGLCQDKTAVRTLVDART